MMRRISRRITVPSAVLILLGHFLLVQEAKAESPVCEYLFEEDTNDNITALDGILDLGTSGNTQSALAFPGSCFGNTLFLDGLDDFVDLTQHVAEFNQTLGVNGRATFSFWIKPQQTFLGDFDCKGFFSGTGAPRCSILAYRRPFVAERFTIETNGLQKLIILDWSTPIMSDSDAIPKCGWSHIAVTVDKPAQRIRAFVNGEEIKLNGVLGGASFSGVGFFNEPLANFFIGQRQGPSIEGTRGSGRYHGGIDELRIFNTVLTDNEIQSLAQSNACTQGHAAACACGTGMSLSDYINTLDLPGNSKNGLLIKANNVAAGCATGAVPHGLFTSLCNDLRNNPHIGAAENAAATCLLQHQCNQQCP